MIDDVEAFRAAWNAASAVQAGERPSPPIQAALDRLATGVLSRVARGSTVEAALKPFRAAVKRGDSVSSPGSLDARVFRDGDRWLVDVRMGYASSVSAYDRSGKRLAVPASMRWSYRQFGGFFRTGTLRAFDGMSLSDAGVRYAYRLGFLRRTAQGYVSAGEATGFSNYNVNAPRLVAKGARIVVNRLDSPRSFSVSNAETLLRRTETWDTSGPVARRVATRLLDPDVRAVDDWLLSHRGSLVGHRRIPRELGMATEIRRGRGWVELDLDPSEGNLHLRFDLALVGKKNIVRKVTLKP